VNNLGNAQMEYENQTFALIPSITGISPTSGSTAGGTNVTITGAGFVGKSVCMSLCYRVS